MIAFFPEFYPDELLYSVLARYYVHSGYCSYICAADDLYIKRTTRPDIEFLNHFTSDVFNVLTKNISMGNIIFNHTMFPYYARFLAKERRITAFNAMLNMEGNYHNLLRIPKCSEKRYLKYCPLCVDEDRKKYSEAYWHRIHQMMGVNICPVHKCYLINSEAAISSDYTPSLISCELSVKQSDSIIFCKNQMECEVAEYISTVFRSEVSMENSVNIGDFLHAELSYTKYKTSRGQKRNLAVLCHDFKEKYMSLKDNNFTEPSQIEKVFSNYRTNTYEICLLAMFLNISPKRLTNPSLPKDSQEDIFDAQILKLKSQGLNYVQIAKRLNASYDWVKYVGIKKLRRQDMNSL